MQNSAPFKFLIEVYFGKVPCLAWAWLSGGSCGAFTMSSFFPKRRTMDDLVRELQA